MLTYIPVKNCDYIVVSFHIVFSCQFMAHIQYIGHGFTGLLTNAAFGFMIYSMYLCVVILSAQSLVLSGCY